ncbi:MAG: hypothetical protein ACRDSK_28320 [Actinophytocola sp.]|uniref:hypothetical protein n=1 Tax=Actinophytocola sp. TaxID=1872138 RepID=UPI003D6C0F03
MKRTSVRTRCLASLAAAGMAAAVVGFVPTATAESSASSASACKIVADISYNASRGTVASFRELFCGPGGESTPLPTILSRNGTIVARGTGFAIYTCRGTTSSTFTATSARPERHPCG